MNSVHRKSIFLALLIAFVMGCNTDHYEYEITLIPKGEALERQLICWRKHTSQVQTRIISFPKAELQRIAAAYETPPPVPQGNKCNFATEVTASTPNDVGGSGTFTHWETSLGSVSTYTERFRGNDNLIPTLETRQQSAERLVTLLADWLAAELEDEPGTSELQQYLHREFREDLKNLSLYTWACTLASHYGENTNEEFLIRVGHYLSERGYFTPEQLPTLLRTLEDFNNETPHVILAQTQRFITSKMGIPENQPIPDCLEFLASATTVENSLGRHLRETVEFKQLLTSWNAERATNPESPEPVPFAVLESLVSETFLGDFELFGNRPDQLHVTLKLPTVPFATNGKWDEPEEQVQWSCNIAATKSAQTEFPRLLYASWSIPHKAEQERHFGQVVLEGAELGRYCLWHQALTEAEAHEWNKFVSLLRPGNTLVGKLKQFRFSNEQSGRENDLAALPRNLILSALNDTVKVKGESTN